MEWQENGYILNARSHGETSAILSAFTRSRGHHQGLVRGGRSKRQRPVLQPGNYVSLSWRARLEDHLGAFTLEPLDLKAASILDERAALAGLQVICSLPMLLPERNPYPRLYDSFEHVLNAIFDAGGEVKDHIWPALLASFELGFLSELGFGLDLSSCAASGSKQDLIYVSPKSGRAVSAKEGEPYKDKLFKLPQFLCADGAKTPTKQDILDGFTLTGYFINRNIYEPRGLKPPETRERMVRLLNCE